LRLTRATFRIGDYAALIEFIAVSNFM
jgi:hypothetical protein